MCNSSCWYDVESTINNVASVARADIFENSLPQGLVTINREILVAIIFGLENLIFFGGWGLGAELPPSFFLKS